jgi:hypothetical protein
MVSKSRRMKWVGHVACMGEGRGVYRVLVGMPEGKRPLGRPRCRWELRNWLAQDRVQWCGFVTMVINLQVPYRKQAIL